MSNLEIAVRNLRMLCLAGLCVMPLASAQAARVYCCTDGSGSRICGDTLPQACYQRAYREVAPSGRVVQEVEAPLTPEQRAQREAEIRAQKERAAREAEAKRRDQVLIDSYANVGEIEKRRDREVANVQGDVTRSRQREAELLKERAKLESLKPKSGPIPRDVVEDLESNLSELMATRSVIDSKQREIDALKSRFEADRRRYLELTAAKGGAR